MEKSQILRESLKQLNKHACAKLNLLPDNDLFVLSDEFTDVDKHCDGEVTIKSVGDAPLLYTAFIQAWAPQKDINSLIAHVKSMPANSILLADFVNPVMAEKFRRRSISFVDCAGNLSIKNDQFDFYVKRKKRPRRPAKFNRGRAFNSAGLKLIFAIFNQPELLHANYRDISKQVKIALGSVGPVMDDLFNSGYVLDEGQRRLVNKKRLFERWVDGYLEKLRPRQILASYSSTDENWWKKARPETYSGLWGGDVFIARSTPFMRPETYSVYFDSIDGYSKFASESGLDKDEDGDICFYKSFWPAALNYDGGVSPMIMYADIVDSINPGNWDVAKTFYGEAVAELLKE